MTTHIEIYDTTLRDGSQTEGISFSVEDKIQIARKLDALGVDFIEGGWPGSNRPCGPFLWRQSRVLAELAENLRTAARRGEGRRTHSSLADAQGWRIRADVSHRGG